MSRMPYQDTGLLLLIYVLICGGLAVVWMFVTLGLQ